MKRNIRIAVLLALALAVAVGLAASAGGGGNGLEFVADIEARDPAGVVLATRQVRANVCEPDGAGGCAISWDWIGESFPAGTEEWARPYFELGTEEVPVAYMNQQCAVDVDVKLCASTWTEADWIQGPSAECLAELQQACGVQMDGRGYYSNGSVSGGETRQASWYEPLSAEWYDTCPLPPATATPAPPAPTYTPQPTLSPNPTPTCRPTWTPAPPPTAYPTHTPYPTATAYPTQPPW